MRPASGVGFGAVGWRGFWRGCSGAVRGLVFLAVGWARCGGAGFGAVRGLVFLAADWVFVLRCACYAGAYSERRASTGLVTAAFRAW